MILNFLNLNKGIQRRRKKSTEIICFKNLKLIRYFFVPTFTTIGSLENTLTVPLNNVDSAFKYVDSAFKYVDSAFK